MCHKFGNFRKSEIPIASIFSFVIKGSISLLRMSRDPIHVPTVDKVVEDSECLRFSLLVTLKSVLDT